MTVIDIEQLAVDEKKAEPAKAEAAQDGSEKAAKMAGIDISFVDLKYTVTLKKPKNKGDSKELDIISNLSGYFEPGKLTALMGPSGSGKTTLMDILAGRKTSAGKISGEVLYGGSAVSKTALRGLCGYVEQFDTLVNELTVFQMLVYTAELKLPSSVSRKDKVDRCNEIIDSLSLQKCRDTVIGNVLKRGISGGQAKRVNIALSLITRPAVIFMDEPTSGLDSRMANEVVSIVKKLAAEGRTVVATVHAPTSYAFSKFDELFMLAPGGKMVYSGTIPDIVPYFGTLGHTFSGSNEYALADWIVDVTSNAAPDDNGNVRVSALEPTDFAQQWADSEKSKAYLSKVTDKVTALKATPTDVASFSSAGPGQFHALRTLLGFRTLAHYKDGEFLGPRIGDKVFLALISLILYAGLGGKKDAQSVQSVAMVLFFNAALCGYGAAAYVPSLTLDRALFFRERADGCYSPVTYYLSKFLEEAVLCVITSLLFCLITFFGIQLQGSFFVFLATYYVTAMTGIVLAYVIASVAPNMEAANALLPTYVTTCMYFSGLFLLFDKIPVYAEWYSYTSFLRYAWAAFMLNQFKGTETGEQMMFYDEDSKSYTNILEFYGMRGDFMGETASVLGMLIFILLFFAVMGALAMTMITHIKR
mmetsp:Transcript_89480/g.164037  ORF Transcript_89480/g.164037 Transcript_89480/m.164037 type:complete len:645 (+) Transcript_89480:87-2021(+)